MRLTHVLMLPAIWACKADTRAPQSVTTPTTTVTTTAPVEHRVIPPPGMTATVFATVPGARMMVLGPDGAVYVSQPAYSQITRLFDANKDGVAESSTIAISGLNRPHGMAFHNGYFYIANTDGVVRVKLDQQGKAIGAPQQLNHYSSGGMHWTRSIVFGADNKMYVAMGSDCNVCEEKNPERASVLQFNDDGSGEHIYSKGLRNAVGIEVNPVTKELWVSQNERDNLKPEHQDLPPEEINILQDGGDYGWPYCWGDRVPNPEFNNAARCASTIPPAFKMQAHSAPLGITFLQNATQLPSDQRGDLLVAFHGSWDRDTPTGAKVVRIHIENNKPVSVSDFATGWQAANGSRWGRPVDVLVYKDGSILVSDDQSGEIVRVAKTGM